MGNGTLKQSIIALLLLSASWTVTTAQAQTTEPSLQSLVSTQNIAGGNESFQWQIVPTYSDIFGFGVGTSLGGYVNDNLALGLVLDYGKNRQEYLANAGVALNEKMKIIGSFGILKEQEEFVLGDGRESLSQLEYGLSLKGNYDAGLVRGFEVNLYHTNAADGSENLEIGDVTGIQAVTQLKPSDNSNVRLGAGFERVYWAEGDVSEGMTFQAIGSHKLSDTLSLNYNAKSAETENVYGVGLSYDMSTPQVKSNRLTVSLNRIDGKNGVSDDRRISLNWTIGLGGAVTSDATAAMPAQSRSELLADVMKRPAFLPERIAVRATEGGGGGGGAGIAANCPVIASGYYSGAPASANGDYYYTARNMSVDGGRLGVAFMSGDTHYVSQNYYDMQTNMATVFSLNDQAPTSTSWSGGGNTYGVDTFYAVYWDGADTLFGVDPATLDLTIDHNGGTCSYTLTPYPLN